jgi:hypothetical protein
VVLDGTLQPIDRITADPPFPAQGRADHRASLRNVTGFSAQEIDFLQKNRSAAMITVDAAGVAKPARVGVVLVDGHLWSSGTQDRVRTKRLRRDPRCTLFVFADAFQWLAIESTVTILDGPDAPDLNVQLFRAMQNRPTGPLSWFGGEMEEDAFRAHLAREGRLIYQFEVTRTYGLA